MILKWVKGRLQLNAGDYQSSFSFQLHFLNSINNSFSLVLHIICSHATLGLYKKLLQRAPKALNR